MYNNYIFSLLVCCFFICLNTVQAQECVEPKDCVVSEWNTWSECSETCGESGTRTRTRTVFQEASCGGFCPFDIQETEPCNIFCCPVDCVFTPWSSWKFCYCSANGCEEEGERYKCKRLREKLSDASCGGYCDEVTTQEACGYLCCYRDCVLSLWSLWTICDAPCEQEGLQNRTRTITQEPVCGGKSCASTTEYRSCTGDCCPVHCVLGEWGEWSECNTSCGEAIQTRQRFVQLPQCNGNPCTEKPVFTETRQCTNYINTDCEVSSWSSWTTCYLDNGFCGKGSKYRSRHMVTSSICQGTECGNLTETGDCSGPCCRQDCQLSEWSVWDHCSSSCGQGVSNRTRAVISWPACGGSPCSSILLESRGCVVTDVINCEFTDWSNWTTCSNDCGEGVVIRSRSMITPAFCGGSCENELTYEENVCESYTARQDCEVSDWSEWSQCERTCEGGIESRNRTLISNPICGGTLCPNITEARTCHEVCEQLCTAGTCRCQQGYRLSSNNYTCAEIVCPLPRVEYCPQTHRYLKDCRYPGFECLKGRKYNATCDPYCATDWTLKGSPQYVTCREDSTWSQPKIFCSRPNDPPVHIEIDNTLIEENTPKDSCIAYLSTITTTLDSYETHTYNITDTETGRLYAKYNRVCLTKTANYEEKPTKWNATIHSYDIDGQSVSVVFEFEILNANDPPTSVTLEPNTIPENSPNGTIVGCFVGADDEVGQTITFNMIDSDRNTFASNTDGDGKTCLKVAKESDPRCHDEGGIFCVLNKELKPMHHVTVIATDDGNPPMSAVYDVPIYLSDVNDKQTSVVMEPARIPENVEPGEPLVQLVVVDEDLNQTYTFRLLRDADGLFQIRDNYLTATKTFNYEQSVGTFYNIEVEATDQSDPTLVVASELNVFVQDLNESPYMIQLTSVGGILQFDSNTPKVKENSQGMVGTVSVMDEDFDDIVNISIEHNEDTRYNVKLTNAKCMPDGNKVNICTVNLVIISAYNYEEINDVKLKLAATDKYGLNITKELRLDIIDVNDPPKVLLFNGKQNDVLTIPENQQDLVIAQLSASDEDINDVHEYEIVNANTRTFIIEDNALKTAYLSSIDYETQDEYTITIQVKDNGTPPQTSDFNVTISITDVNETPKSTILSDNTVSEHAPFGTVVGILSTEDPDNAMNPNNQYFQYALSDDSLGRFTKLSTQLCGVKTCRLDYETEPTVTLKVVTIDNGVPRLQREDKLVVVVKDANDPPTDIRIDASTIRENESPGKMIGTLSSYDEDEQDIATYSVADFSDVFEVKDGDKLYASISLDYEMLNSYWLTIVAQDNGNPPSENRRPIVIRVIDVNEQPIFSAINNTLTIGDDKVLNDSIATIVVTDPDTADSVDVRLQDMSETFALSVLQCSTLLRTGATECSIDVILIKELDVKKSDKYSIDVTANDKHGLETKENMQIFIEDVNNAPSEILLDGLAVTELKIIENTQDIVVSELKTIDKDTDQMHAYAIVENPNSFFQLEGSTLKIASNATIDFESTQNEMTLKLSVKDSGSPQLSYMKGLSISLIDVNEAPVGVTLYPNKVMENAIKNTVIGNMSVNDPESEQIHTLKLVNDAHGLFILDGNVLKVNDGDKDCTTVSNAECKINYEHTATYTVSVEVLDSGNPPLRGVFGFDVQVTDINEPPRNIRLTGNKFKLGSPIGTVIGSLSVHDDDIGQSHSFKLLGTSEYIEVSVGGQITVLDSGNLVEGQIFEVMIKATDSGSPPLSADENVKLIVVGTNVLSVVVSPKAPAKPIADGILVTENTKIDSTIGIVNVHYPVLVVAVTIGVAEGETHVNVTNIQCSNDLSGTKCEAEIKLISELNFEKMVPIDVVLQSSAGESKSLDYVRIEIKDINEVPKAVSFSSGVITVHENSPGQLLGQFYVLDDDLTDSHDFAINGEGKEFLTLKELGKLYCKSDISVDFEVTQTFNITVTVTDSGGLTLAEEFIVTVIDANEAPFSLDISNNKVNEMAGEGTEVGLFTVKDYDANQTHIYELVADPTGAFFIDGSKLVVHAGGPNCQSKGGSSCFLDYESNNEYKLVVKVTDNGSPPLSGIFTNVIRIIDVNDPPRSVALTSTKMLENQASSYEIASVSALDDDTGQIISFGVLENPHVSLEEDRLLLKQEVSYETTNQFTISIIASDNGAPSMSTTTEFTITVIDVNESPTSLIFTSTAESLEQFTNDKPVISENVPELTFIGQLILLDPDIDESLTIESYTTDVVIRNFKCIPVTAITSAADLNYEEKEIYDLTIQVTDSGEPPASYLVDVVVKITDINEEPNGLFLSSNKILETAVVDDVVGSLIVSDPDIGNGKYQQEFTFKMLDEGSLFKITDDKLFIKTVSFDYESRSKYDETIIVFDNGVPNLSTTFTVTITVVDVNEAPNYLDFTGFSVMEDVDLGAIVGILNAKDPDENQALTYHVIGTGLLSVNGDGVVVNGQLDYETQSQLSFIARVSDNGYPSLSFEKEFIVEVTDVNEAPSSISILDNADMILSEALQPGEHAATIILTDEDMTERLQLSLLIGSDVLQIGELICEVDILLDTEIESVPENTANFVIGTLNTIDQDSEDSHIYIVISPWEMFTVIGNKLTTTSQLNYETSAIHTVYIRARDNGNPPQSLTKSFIINVKDVNEAPSDIAVKPTEIANDITAGQVVAQVVVTDPDNFGREYFQNHTCTITPTDVLEIDNSNLQIKVLGRLPPDAITYDVSVTCSDVVDNPLSVSIDFTFSVVDTVNVPKVIQLLDDTGSNEISVDENVVDVIVGQLSVINILTKSIVPGIKVIDVNEAPTGIGISGMRSVSENAAVNTFIGDMITYDPETYQSYTYTLLGVNYGMEVTENDVEMVNAFTINGDALKVGFDNHFINYEVSGIMTLLIDTKDSGDPVYNLISRIHLIVNDDNDPPTNISLSNNTISEDSVTNSLIGTFSVHDEDANQEHACELLNLIDVPFKISDGTSLVVASPVLDFETAMAYTVEVTCGDTLMDGTRLRYTKSFVINVTNVNEPPFNITVSSYVIQENNLIGQIIAEIKAVDLDSSEILYTLVEENDWAFFHIEGDSTLVADAEFNFESSKRFYTITVRAEDDMGSFAIETFEFEVQDLNETPEEIVLDNLSVYENASPGSKIGIFTTTDPDRNQQFVYSIDTDVFVVDGDSLRIGETGLDYEMTTSYDITVMTTDNGVPPKSLQQVISLDILDTNDRPVSITTGQIDSVPENSLINTVLLTFTVDDPDEGQRHSCYAESLDNIVMVVKGSGDDDMNLVLSGTLDYETFNTLAIHLSCTDGEFEIAKDIELHVADINEAPTSITLTGSNTILADSSPGTVIGTLSVEDEDIGQTHTFVINGQNSDVVKISNQNELTLISPLPKAILTSLDSSLKFIVTAADNGSPVQTYNETIIIPITNVVIEPDGLPKITSSTFRINSTFIVGDVVGSLFSTDIIDASVNVVLLNNPSDLFTIVNNSLLGIASDINGVPEKSINLEVEVSNALTLEKETHSIIVVIETDLTCSEDKCTENESCVSMNETYHVCECHNDFNRNSEGVCTKINHCEMKLDGHSEELCLNGGECVDDVDGYVCHCVDGFSGSQCEIRQNEVNVCNNTVCQNSGICVPKEDEISFECICTSGWTGLHCNASVDDCIDKTCYNNGKCIDKHLTFRCQCDDIWKGLRCEYHRSVCSEPKCSGALTCVGRVLSNETLCVGDDHLVMLSYNRQESGDVSEFQARLVDFIINHGRLTRTGSSTKRKKRQTESVTYNEDIEIYVSEANEADDRYIYSMVVMNGDGPLTREVVLNELSLTCKRINSADQIEDVFCPSILSAAAVDKRPRLPTGSNAGLIAGVASQTRNPELQTRDHENSSASGYASMPQVETATQQDVVAVPAVKTIDVLPANVPINNARYESTA
ncbi:hypothetical protein ACF0H5_003108 [Mactra antiquata]